MIRAEGLTKYYGDFPAVQDVTFRVPEGEIVGFLGPNGAGKSTVMKILSCFMSPTSGKATIAGHDVFTESLQVRRSLGYMPENVPLYPDMRVEEFLRYRAKVKGVSGRDLRTQLEHVLDGCWIQDVRRQLIRTLSKGYRQRVGLADAIIHNPKVLILDEPTIGLDPTQIRSVRDLIKGLKEKHTILLSTHILPEVEMICDRVIIIHQGRVVTSSTLSDLGKQSAGAGSVVAEIEGDREQVSSALKDVSGVKKVSVEERGQALRVSIEHDPGKDLASEVARLATSRGWPVKEIRRQEKSLEEIFVEITARE